jgi:hypothetical protein
MEPAEDIMVSIAKSLSTFHHFDGRISVCVQPFEGKRWAVYVNAVVVAIHNNQCSADGHCQRLRNQQL